MVVVLISKSSVVQVLRVRPRWHHFCGRKRSDSLEIKNCVCFDLQIFLCGSPLIATLCRGIAGSVESAIHQGRQ